MTDAWTIRPRATPSPTTSTRRWSSKPPQEPARRPSWSAASCACWPRARRGVGDLVAVTFTEKAAGELKLRLRQELERRAGDAGARRRRERARSKQALQNLEEAHISTIHGFCADLLRERPVEARYRPAVPRAHRGRGAAPLRRGVRSPGFRSALEDTPEGVRRSLRRSSGPRGPVARRATTVPSNGCARRAGTWPSGATSGRSWTRPEFDRAPRRSRTLVAARSRVRRADAHSRQPARPAVRATPPRRGARATSFA